MRADKKKSAIIVSDKIDSKAKSVIRDLGGVIKWEKIIY